MAYLTRHHDRGKSGLAQLLKAFRKIMIFGGLNLVIKDVPAGREKKKYINEYHE